MAESCLDDLERWTSHTRAHWSLPLVERCHALLAEGTDAERRFEEALLLHQMSSAFDRARTQLLHGEFLRRARRRADARPHLRAAVEMFASVHAALWEERARRSFGCGSTVSRTLARAPRRRPSLAADLPHADRWSPGRSTDASAPAGSHAGHLGDVASEGGDGRWDQRCTGRPKSQRPDPVPNESTGVRGVGTGAAGAGRDDVDRVSR